MKRMTFPVLALVFSLCFSGRPLRSLEKQMACYGNTIFYNSSSITLTKVEITDLVWGGTTTLTSFTTFPGFPSGSYSNLSSDFTVTKYFSAPHSGNIQISIGNGNLFFCTRFDSTSTVTYNVHLDCNLNIVRFVNDDAPINCNSKY